MAQAKPEWRKEMNREELESKVELWKRSYHESERCLIERGKLINELEEEISELEENQITVEDIKNREIVDRLKLAVGKHHGKTGYEYVDKVLHDILHGDKK